MKLSMADYHKCNPMRDPKWRYGEAVDLLANGVMPTRYDDRWTRIMFVYLRARAALGPKASLRNGAVKRRPYLPGMWALYNDVSRREMLEARLLAGESDEEIGKRFCLVPEAVDLYEHVFFNVRDRLDATDWIAKMAIGINGITGTAHLKPERREYAFYKWVAYHGGSEALDAAIAKLPIGSIPQSSADLGPFLEEGAKTGSAVHALAGLMAWQGSGPDLVALCNRMRKFESQQPETTRRKTASP